MPATVIALRVGVHATRAIIDRARSATSTPSARDFTIDRDSLQLHDPGAQRSRAPAPELKMPSGLAGHRDAFRAEIQGYAADPGRSVAAEVGESSTWSRIDRVMLSATRRYLSSLRET
jgi:hypothetical protein